MESDCPDTTDRWEAEIRRRNAVARRSYLRAQVAQMWSEIEELTTFLRVLDKMELQPLTHSEATKLGLQYAKERGVKLGNPNLCGPSAKLPAGGILRARREAGESVPAMAREYGVTRQAVYARLKRLDDAA